MTNNGQLIVFSIASVLLVYALWEVRRPDGGSSAMVAVTVALCLITGLYAWLTKRLVDLNQQHLKELRRSTFDTQRGRMIIFVFLADRVNAAVHELPAHVSDSGFDTTVRTGVLWRPEELRELEQLAAYLGPWVAMPLVQIVNYLNWISNRVDEIRAVPLGIGFDYKSFPAEKWEEAWRESTRQLQIIAGIARGQVSKLEGDVAD